MQKQRDKAARRMQRKAEKSSPDVDHDADLDISQEAVTAVTPPATEQN